MSEKYIGSCDCGNLLTGIEDYCPRCGEEVFAINELAFPSKEYLWYDAILDELYLYPYNERVMSGQFCLGEFE